MASHCHNVALLCKEQPKSIGCCAAPGAGDNSAGGTGVRTRIIAGVTAAAAAALMALGGLYWLLRLRRANAVKHDAHALQEAGQSGMGRVHSHPVTHDDLGRQYRTAQHDTSKDTACLVAVSPYGGQKLPTSAMPSIVPVCPFAGLPLAYLFGCKAQEHRTAPSDMMALHHAYIHVCRQHMLPHPGALRMRFQVVLCYKHKAAITCSASSIIFGVRGAYSLVLKVLLETSECINDA